MSESRSKKEANLGRLLFGNRSPVSLHVCLKPKDTDAEVMNSLDPFEVINLGVGRRYVLAHLNVGDGFSEQYLLLNIYNPRNDSDAVAELDTLARVKKDERIPLPSVVDFDRDKTSFSPTFYCTHTKIFFHVPCAVCSSILEHEPEDDTLFCPRCKDINSQNSYYSFFEVVDNPDTILLEDLFSQYANTNQLHSSVPFTVPCSGCERAKQCFPESGKMPGAVANESHFIIPFSYESFSMYGFSYYPLSLIDYCELVSGKPKSDLLKMLKKTKETGKYRVLVESGTFSSKKTEQDYLTVKSPDLLSILSIKLRVFMRVCNLNQNFNSADMTNDSIRMDVSQTYSAGDSFTRAKMVFLYSGAENKSIEKDAINSVPKYLSHLLFLILFKNANSNELSVKVAVDSLIEQVNQHRDLTLQGLEEIINSSESISTTFSIKSLLYDAAAAPDMDDDLVVDNNLSDILVLLIRLGLVLTSKIGKNVFSLKINAISVVIEELRKIFSLLDLNRDKAKSYDDDQELLFAALGEIISDNSWVDNMFPREISTNSSIDDSTIVDDKTVMMKQRDRLNQAAALDKTVSLSSKLSENMETDEVFIMSSINRILRQL